MIRQIDVKDADLQCPLCGSASSPAFTTTDRNRRHTSVAFRYSECRGCGVTFLENVPSDLGDYYTAGYHQVPRKEDLDAAAGPEAYKLDLVRRWVPRGSVVDIGSSYGAFPYLARRAGYGVTAIEVDPECCGFIADVIGARAIHSAEPEAVLPSLSGADAITLWHSIEHLAQPWRTLQAAAEALRPGGVLVVATPNPAGLQARMLGARWAHVDAPRHLFLIPPDALFKRAAACQLSAVQATARDEETYRCNAFGWQRAARELCVTPRVAGYVGFAIARGVRPLETRVKLGSAYVAVFLKT